MTLDEWVEKNCPELKRDIGIHLEAMAGDALLSEDITYLLRLIMISIRQKYEK